MFVAFQPDTVTGDIVFVLQQKEHPKFKRKGDDIFYEHTLSLTEALCGFHFRLTHLDGRQLLIKSEPGEVVKPGKLYFIFFSYIGFYSSIQYMLLPCVSNPGFTITFLCLAMLSPYPGLTGPGALLCRGIEYKCEVCVCFFFWCRKRVNYSNLTLEYASQIDIST